MTRPASDLVRCPVCHAPRGAQCSTAGDHAARTLKARALPPGTVDGDLLLDDLDCSASGPPPAADDYVHDPALGETLDVIDAAIRYLVDATAAALRARDTATLLDLKAGARRLLDRG